MTKSSDRSTYKGLFPTHWSTDETTYIYLVYSASFRWLCKNRSFDSLEKLAEILKADVHEREIRDQKFYGVYQPGNLMLLLALDYLDKVKWMEIADYLSEKLELCLPKEAFKSV